MPAKKLLVPMRYGKGTGMLHDTQYARGALSTEEAAAQWADDMTRLGHNKWSVDYVMTEAKPFTARLRYIGHYRGKSAFWFEFMDVDTGARWPVLADDFDVLVPKMVGGEIPTTTYEPCKRGQAYGIRIAR